MSKFTPKPFGKYFLLDKLAVGGMAEIYKAKTFGVDGFEKLLVIKKILPHCSADKDFINMLVDEAKLSVLLSHTNIVQVYDLGKVGDDYFISMEFIDGSNLRQVINRGLELNQKLPVEIIVYIVSEICKGLDYAHHRRDTQNRPLTIVHRDISPQNILISYEGEVKIVDFGIAKAAMNMSHTLAGMLKGKVSYMSPEQALGKPLDGRTDIFSAGSLFYELLTGKKLFTGESQFEVLKKIHSTYITEASFPDSIPATLKPLLAKALAYRAKDRYENAGDFQIELTKHLYSTYGNFSPRQLSALLQSWFAEDLQTRKEKAIEEMQVLDAKTQTLLMRTPAQNIVHRDNDDEEPSQRTRLASITPAPDKAPAPEEHALSSRTATLVRPTSRQTRELASEANGALASIANPAEAAPPREKEKTQHTGTQKKKPGDSKKILRIAAAVAAFALAASAAYGLKSYFKKRNAPPPEIVEPVETPPAVLPKASLRIETTPPGAAIAVDSIDSGQTSPSTIADLEIGRPYRFSLSKQGFYPIEKEFIASSPAQLSWRLDLKPVLGELIVESNPPGAAVFLNDQDTGTITPAHLRDLKELAVGQSLVLTLKKEGYSDLKQTVTLTPERMSQTLVLSMQALPPPPPVPPKQDLPPKEPDAKPDKKEKKEEKRVKTPPVTPPPAPPTSPPPPDKPVSSPPSAATGPTSITLDSIPSGAIVLINGAEVGRTPGTFTVTPGKVKLTLEGKDMDPYKLVVNVNPNEKKNLGTVDLKRPVGKVRIESVPKGATITIDGEKAGNTPLVLQGVLKNKEYRVNVSYPGYKTSSKILVLTEKSLEWVVTMERE